MSFFDKFPESFIGSLFHWVCVQMIVFFIAFRTNTEYKYYLLQVSLPIEFETERSVQNSFCIVMTYTQLLYVLYFYTIVNRVARCPVLYRTVRYLDQLSGIKTEAIPDMFLSGISDLPTLLQNFWHVI